MKVGILGSGAYGVALSDELNRVGNDVTLWTYSKVEKNMISMLRKTPKLPNHEIDVNIFITDEMEKAVDNKDILKLKHQLLLLLRVYQMKIVYSYMKYILNIVRIHMVLYLVQHLHQI